MVPAYLEAGCGAAVVFLHGIGGEASLWRRQIAHFSTCFRAIAWDMPGYGRTPLLAATRWDSLADAVIRLLDDLRIERAHLVGHSMGGMLAQHLAHRDRRRVASLALAGTSAVFGSADGRFQKQFLAARLEPLDAGRTLSELAPDLIADLLGDNPDPAGVDEAVGAMAVVDPIAYRATLQCLATFDNRANISALAVPTLLIAGEKDRAAPPAGMERMAARIAGSRYVCLPGCGHLMHLEQPETFNAVLDEFYAALEQAGAMPT